MPVNGRKVVQITKYLLTGVTIFCVSWIACVSEWHAVQWGGRERWAGRSHGHGAPTMRTIVAYSEGKQAELDRPYPVTCERLPAFPNVPVINRTWSPGVTWDGRASWQRVPRANITLYNAYYDNRFQRHYVRILATFPGHFYPAEEQLFCQTRRKNVDNADDPYGPSIEVVTVKAKEIWFPSWDSVSEYVETPLLLSCPLTEPLYEPSIVSVVTETCEDPSNAFIVEPNNRTNYDRMFTVCVKDLTFKNDISRKLVEWLEINKILGVDKVDMYVDKIHETTAKTLEYYRNTGFVRLFHVPINHTPKQDLKTLWQRRRDHIITINDCLYRNIQESQFIIPLDVDEIILPKVANNLHELTRRLIDSGWKTAQQSALVQNMFFFDYIQNSDKLKYNASNDKELFMKRDNVRYSDKKNLNKDVNLSNEVDEIDDNFISEKYRVKCGTKLVIPKVLRHTTRSAHAGDKYAYSKSLMVTKHVLMAFNHFPLTSRIGSLEFITSGHWFAPSSEVQLNHYKESCNKLLVSCDKYERPTLEDHAIFRLRRRIMQALAVGPCLRGIN